MAEEKKPRKPNEKPEAILARLLEIKKEVDAIKEGEPLTYQQIADKMGIDKNYICRANLQKIYGLAVEELFYNEDTNPKGKVLLLTKAGEKLGPVFNGTTITIPDHLLKDVQLMKGTRFVLDIKAKKGNKEIASLNLIPQGVDEDYLVKIANAAATRAKNKAEKEQKLLEDKT